MNERITCDAVCDGVEVAVPQPVHRVTAFSDGQQHVAAIVRHLENTHTHVYVCGNVSMTCIKTQCVCALPQLHSSTWAGQGTRHTEHPGTAESPTRDSTASDSGSWTSPSLRQKQF